MNHWQIKDLKGVGDVELELDDSKRVFVLFGSNGVGKTKTLEALSLFNFIHINNINFSIHNLIEEEDNLLFNEISLNDRNFELKKLVQELDYLLTDYIEIFDKPIEALVFLNAQSRSQIDNQQPLLINTTLGSHERRRQEAIFSSIDLMFEKGIQNHQETSVNRWFIERAVSVNPYQKEDDNRKVDIDTVLEALNKLDNRIEQTLNVDGDGHVFLTVEGQERELSELSSGFISVVKIIQSIISSYSAFTNATDLLNVKGVVLIDEIESHLHVEWQTKIIPTLKNLFPNTIFYIATHSPLVLSQLEEGEAYLLKRDEDDVVRSEVIRSPNKRIFSSVLEDAFGIDLNQLKRDSMEHSDQSKAKSKLLALLNDKHNKEGYFSE